MFKEHFNAFQLILLIGTEDSNIPSVSRILYVDRFCGPWVDIIHTQYLF